MPQKYKPGPAQLLGIPAPRGNRQAMRRYKRTWQRIRMRGTAYRQRRNRANRASLLRDPRRAAKHRRQSKAWRRRNKRYVARKYRAYYRKYLQKRCHECDRPGKCGRGCLVPIERIIAGVPQTLLFCRTCAGIG